MNHHLLLQGAVFSNLQLIHIPTPKFQQMNVFLSLHSSTISLSCSYKPPKPLFSSKIIPPRDKIIDFGKFKGKMLGTLPSTYLKWVSKNLRARDFEEWAKLADEVLNDPVYKDRIEWEFAEKLLNGEVLTSPLVQESNHNAVSELLEMSERFGWDNDDKAGWSKIDFKLIGTSQGGRIPRVHDNRSDTNTTRHEGRKMGLKKKRVVDKEVEERRKERRERLRLSKSSNGLPMKGAMERIEDNDKGSFGIHEDPVVNVQSPFPGREGLLKKVLNRRKI